MRDRAAGAIACATVALCALPAAAAAAQPIPEGAPPQSPPPKFVGHRADRDPLPGRAASDPPRHPFMAPNDDSNIHDDAYQTDTADRPGPRGRAMSRVSTFQKAECASLTFDRKGRVETVCVGLDRPRLVLMDPRTLDTLATLDLPPRQPGGGNPFSDFSGGGYFYLDNKDRAVVVTNDRHLYVVAQTHGPGFQLERDYDLSEAVGDNDKLVAAMPDWEGLIWVVSRKGKVLTVRPRDGRIQLRDTGEPIGNSFAADETGGIYIVTDAAMYRFDADHRGRPRVTWREVYDNDHTQKPGQTEQGSGTTPTLMGDDYVAITDNAPSRIQVVVYRRGRHVGGKRKVCEVPVFKRGMSSTDNSLIGTRRSMVIENNFGYTGPSSTEQGGSTVPGIWRVDIDRDGRGCHVVWRNDKVRAPSVVPKLSLREGLVYTYTKPLGDQDDPWYLTALDFDTGKLVYKRLAGRGLGFNNNYAPVSLGADGTAYVGVIGGLAALRDR